MRLRLIRHATIVIEIGGHRLLIDPLLGPAGSQPPIPDSANDRRNPLVELPIAATDVVAGISAVLITHLHPDHIDMPAIELLRGTTVLCQPGDVRQLTAGGLTPTPVPNGVDAAGIRIMRTGGRHGTGAIGREMGEVSGFVFSADREPTVYLAGDTVWCAEVESALSEHQPDVIVVNAGAARFVAGDPITMDIPDVLAVCAAAPEAVVVAVHMEAINHCGLTRTVLRDAADAAGFAGRVLTPADGETLELTVAA